MDQHSNDSPEFESWEQQADPGPGEQIGTNLSSQFSGLNVNAKPFVPNVHAPEFVPNFGAPDASSSQSEQNERSEEEPMVVEKMDTVNNSESPTPMEDDIPDKEEEPPDLNSGSVDTSPEPSDGNGTATPPVKKANSEDDDEESKKEPINVIFIGHVDAGKSTIGGHIMYLTGGIDKRTLEKYEREAKEKNRESWYLSWALDTNQEERDKGKTVEVGRAAFSTEKKHFTILDAPGHKSFVPNMIGGAAQADLAVLVISARKGEFETGFERGGQTREHAMLAKTAGVKHLVVLINKMDDPTVDWSEARYEECKAKLVPFLKKVGFNPKKDIYFIPVSGITGANLKDSSDSVSWYSGPPFIQYIDDLPSLLRNSDGPLRMPITDKYKDMGTILLGKIESGKIYKGTNLVLMPNKNPIEVLQITVEEREKDVAQSGENVKIKVKGIEEEDVLPGFVLCEPTNLCHSCKVFNAQIIIIEHKSIICPGYSAVLHIHTAVEEAKMESIAAIIDKKTGAKGKTKPRFIKQDQVAIAKFKVTEGICIEAFEDFPQMGRFTLRDEGKTIAIGKVLELCKETE